VKSSGSARRRDFVDVRDGRAPLGDQNVNRNQLAEEVLTNAVLRRRDEPDDFIFDSLAVAYN